MEINHEDWIVIEISQKVLDFLGFKAGFDFNLYFSFWVANLWNYGDSDNFLYHKHITNIWFM